MNISKLDVGWSFIATLLRIASSLILLPFVLTKLPSEDIGLWTIFLTISSFVLIFDFGFGQTFTRNIAYIFSGARELKSNGYVEVNFSSDIDYSLLKGTLKVMRRYYLFSSIVFLIIILSIGTYYIFTLLEKYNGNRDIIYFAWYLFSLLVVYQLYTLYYDSLLQGRGMIRISKQIIIVAQLSQIIITILTLYMGFGMISLVLGQITLVIVNRLLGYRAFFDKEICSNLKKSKEANPKELFNIYLPNAVKIGLTSLGGFLVAKSSIFIGSMFLSLSEIASFGITKQIIDVIAGVGAIYFATFYPKLIQFRLNNNPERIKKTYIESKYFLIGIFIIGSITLLTSGEILLQLIGSQTKLISNSIIVILLLISFLEANHSMAGSMIMTKNEIPFVKASILSGLGTVTILIIYYPIYLCTGLWGLVLAQGIPNIVYQNWKWPLTVFRDLNISKKDLILWK